EQGQAADLAARSGSQIAQGRRTRLHQGHQEIWHRSLQGRQQRQPDLRLRDRLHRRCPRQVSFPCLAARPRRARVVASARRGLAARQLGQNGCCTPNRNCTGVSTLTVLATSKRNTVRSTKLNQLTSNRRPAPSAWATGPTERPFV